MFFRLTLIILLNTLLLDSSGREGLAGEGQWTEPWQKEGSSAREKGRNAGESSSATQKVGQGLIRFFQVYISPVDGDRCPSYPTCSQYAMEAVRKHGALAGLVMGFGRLIHEADEIHRAPQIRVHDSYRYYDPVENNDFWWKKELGRR
jgi:putative membrane protein insertion efficiency factor